MLAALALAGCAQELRKDLRPHVVMFRHDGVPVDPAIVDRASPSTPLPADAGGFFSAYRRLDPEAYGAYLDDLFLSLSRSGKSRVALVIHGGLVTQPGSVRRVLTLSATGLFADYHPVFVNWQASLRSSYWDRLFYVRRGVSSPVIALLTSPFVLAADLGMGLARAPLVWSQQLWTFLEGWPFFDRTLGSGLAAARARSLAAARAPAGGSPGMDVHTPMRDHYRWWNRALPGLELLLTEVPFKMPASVVIDALGTPSWNVMLRRTQLLFDPEPGATPYGGPPPPGAPAVPGDDLGGRGALPAFLRRLGEWQRVDPEVREVTLLAHSMGTIVADEIMRQMRGLEFRTIVFMAAADSIRGYESAAWPYLFRHPRATMNHLTLHHLRDVRSSDYPWLGWLYPRGSLLAWIDDFLGNPNTPLDRVAGRFDNLSLALDRTPLALRGRIRVVELDGYPWVPFAGRRPHPQIHGAFDEYEFWTKAFRREP